ncbi:MAG: DUF559 domain-containing protein [Pseudomonadota bacterium]
MRDPRLTSRAKEMRKRMPEPERRMWHQLRAERFQGIKFRRQKVIGRYIADFASNSPKLIVEIDGDSHSGQEHYDDERTQYFEDQGYKVIRFPNSNVMDNMDGVLARLSELIAEMLACPPPPTPSPSGEGAL